MFLENHVRQLYKVGTHRNGSQRKTCIVHFLSFLHHDSFCKILVCILESPGVRGEGFGDVPQILGWVQQRSWLHGLLVQVTLLPVLLVSTWYTDKVYVISVLHYADSPFSATFILFLLYFSANRRPHFEKKCKKELVKFQLNHLLFYQTYSQFVVLVYDKTASLNSQWSEMVGLFVLFCLLDFFVKY